MPLLRALTAEHFADFVEVCAHHYAQDNIDSGRWPAEGALEQARGETHQLLPGGPATPGHDLFEICNPAGEVAGYLWLGDMQQGRHTVSHVYQVVVLPAFRRQGLARAALLAAEAHVRAKGHAALSLHVFSQNEAAQALYRSIGYEVTSLNMSKPLSR